MASLPVARSLSAILRHLVKPIDVALPLEGGFVEEIAV
jgi:hypothetical protein